MGNSKIEVFKTVFKKNFKDCINIFNIKNYMQEFKTGITIDFISKNLLNTVVNIMGQYRPEYHALEFKDISRRVSIDEVLTVKEYADKLNIYQI